LHSKIMLKKLVSNFCDEKHTWFITRYCKETSSSPGCTNQLNMLHMYVPQFQDLNSTNMKKSIAHSTYILPKNNTLNLQLSFLNNYNITWSMSIWPDSAAIIAYSIFYVKRNFIHAQGCYNRHIQSDAHLQQNIQVFLELCISKLAPTYSYWVISSKTTTTIKLSICSNTKG
jgi:hypothetical protein